MLRIEYRELETLETTVITLDEIENYLGNDRTSEIVIVRYDSECRNLDCGTVIALIF